MAKLLISFGADLESVNNNGEAPLHWAAVNGQLELCKLLVEAGADFLKANGLNKTASEVAYDMGLNQVAVNR